MEMEEEGDEEDDEDEKDENKVREKHTFDLFERSDASENGEDARNASRGDHDVRGRDVQLIAEQVLDERFVHAGPDSYRQHDQPSHLERQKLRQNRLKSFPSTTYSAPGTLLVENISRVKRQNY